MASTPGLASLPNEIIADIAGRLPTLREKVSFSRVSRRFYRIGLPEIYEEVEVIICGSLNSLDSEKGRRDSFIKYSEFVRTIKLQDHITCMSRRQGRAPQVEKSTSIFNNISCRIEDPVTQIIPFVQSFNRATHISFEAVFCHRFQNDTQIFFLLQQVAHRLPLLESMDLFCSLYIINNTLDSNILRPLISLPPHLARFDIYVYVAGHYWWKLYNLSSEVLELMTLFFGPPEHKSIEDGVHNPSYWQWGDLRISISLADIQTDAQELEEIEVVDTTRFALEKIFDYSILCRDIHAGLLQFLPGALQYQKLHRIFLPNQGNKEIAYNPLAETIVFKLAQVLPVLSKVIWCMEEFPIRADGIEPRSDWCIWTIIRKDGAPLSIENEGWIHPEEIIEMDDPFFDRESPRFIDLLRAQFPTYQVDAYEDIYNVDT
ncbi:hypothetical protein AA313_de0205328 [Arthrobotrys entomopaga]|nr:hypothetical protein AA313_de0205328 [Arthrobotrys entomopaga]